jgi:Ribbon-helix-helix domain
MATKPTTRKQRFQVMLDPGQLAALRRIETRTGAPLAAQIRRAIDAYLRPPARYRP